MINKVINSTQAPAIVGPYSYSVLARNTLYISGQLGLDLQSGEMKTTVGEQAKQAFTNLGSILKETEMIYDNVVKTTVLSQHMSDFSKINGIYGSYFSEALPIRSCVEVVKSSKNGLFKTEAAVVKG